MRIMNSYSRAFGFWALAALAAHANPINSGSACASASSTCDWYQWANSGPVVTTVQSMSNGLDGASNFVIGGGLFFDGGNQGAPGSNPAPGSGGTTIYGSDPDPDFPADAFWLNPIDSTTPPCDPSDGIAPPPAVPEPGSLGLLGLGLVALGFRLRRRR